MAQIFKYLPRGLANGLDIDLQNVTMHSLQPYDSRNTVGFIRTLAYCFIPSDHVDKLRMDLHTPNSKLYNSDNKSVWKLIDMIDPSIPLLATDTLEDGGNIIGGDNGSWLGGDKGNTDNSGDTEDDGGSLLGSDEEDPGSSPVMGKSVGIGVGVVLGAAVYGAAMFFVARRYRRRRLGHGRASSISRSMSPGSNPAGALMAGALMGGAVMSGANAEKRGSNGSGGRTSARGQTISGPMQAENSLGWN